MVKKNDDKTKASRKPVAVNEGPVKKMKVISWLLIAMAGSIIIYWILYHTTGVFTLRETGVFDNFRMPFLLGTVFLIIMALTAGVQLLLQKEDAIAYGIITGSTLVFAALISIHFNLAQGVYSQLGFAMGFEAFANAFSFVFGIYIIMFFWNNRDYILKHKEMGPGLPRKKKI